MSKNEMIDIIKKEYVEIVKSLNEAEKEYNADKRSVKKREVYQFIAAQEMLLSDLCEKLDIELDNEF